VTDERFRIESDLLKEKDHDQQLEDLKKAQAQAETDRENAEAKA